MDMEREIINLTEYDLIPLIDEFWKDIEEYWEADDNGIIEDEDGEYIIKNGEWNNYELIETTLDYYDLEDAYEVNNHIIQRLSDGKYFKFYSKSYYCDNIVIPKQEIKEVFLKEVIKVIYE